jgi:glycosyltransferase involved in cell wall biosynthesis
MKKDPLVSILMPVYNSFDYERSENKNLITNAIDSLLAQTFCDFELLILDNLSIDNTQDVCRKYESIDSRVRLIIDTKRRNPEKSIEHVSSYAKGEYCMIANDDDSWDPLFLETMVNFLNSNNNIDLCYCNVIYSNTDNKLISKEIAYANFIYDKDFTKKSMLSRYILNRNPIPITFGLFKKSILLKTLPYEEFDILPHNIDNILILKLLLNSSQIHFINKYLFTYRVKDRGLTPEKCEGMPQKKDLDQIFIYFLRHHLRYHQKTVLLLSKEFKRFTNEYYFFNHLSLYSFFKFLNNQWNWLMNYTNSEQIHLRSTIYLNNSLNKIMENIFNFYPEIDQYSFEYEDNLLFAPKTSYFLNNIIQEALIELKHTLIKYNRFSELLNDSFILLEEELKVIEEHQTKLLPQLSCNLNFLKNPGVHFYEK